MYSAELYIHSYRKPPHTPLTYACDTKSPLLLLCEIYYNGAGHCMQQLNKPFASACTYIHVHACTYTATQSLSVQLK